MNRDLLVYFLLLLLPVFALPYAAHRLLSDERTRGRETGTACLQAKAEALALRMRLDRLERLPATDGATPVQAALVENASGRVLDGEMYADGRCVGTASLAPERPGLSVLAQHFIGGCRLQPDVQRHQGVVLPPAGGLLGMFGRGEELCIPWDCIERIGEDIILVRVEPERVDGKHKESKKH